MRYAACYAGKVHLLVANLLRRARDNLVRFNHFAAERQAHRLSTDTVDRTRRTLQSLVGATNRRMHVGFPCVYAFLLRKPIHHCSHLFMTWSLHHLIQLCTGEVLEHWTADGKGNALTRWTSPTTCLLATLTTQKGFDYSYRRGVMEKLYIHFVLSGTKVVRDFFASTLDWFVATDGSGGLHPY